MRISDWSSDVCSSDLTGKELHSAMPLDQFGRAIDGFRSPEHFGLLDGHGEALPVQRLDLRQKIHALGARVDEEPARSRERPELALQLAHRLLGFEIGSASGRERVCQYV